jgi:hypothetical protein
MDLKKRKDRAAAKAERLEAAGGPKKKLLYLPLDEDVHDRLKAEALAEDRPMTVQAARILKMYFQAKDKARQFGSG